MGKHAHRANLGAMLIGWVITGMLGITLSYHRQLSHKAFATPKWLEYTLAYCGVMAMQVRTHRALSLPPVGKEGAAWHKCMRRSRPG